MNVLRALPKTSTMPRYDRVVHLQPRRGRRLNADMRVHRHDQVPVAVQFHRHPVAQVALGHDRGVGRLTDGKNRGETSGPRRLALNAELLG